MMKMNTMMQPRMMPPKNVPIMPQMMPQTMMPLMLIMPQMTSSIMPKIEKKN